MPVPKRKIRMKIQERIRKKARELNLHRLKVVYFVTMIVKYLSVYAGIYVIPFAIFTIWYLWS